MNAPVSARRIRVNGIELNVHVEGQGPDVLLVHGFPDSLDVWRKQIPALVAAGYRVIAPDMRGYGLSDAPRGRSAYKADQMVADLAVLLDALNVSCVRLVGHDWGALIGWLFCIAHPDRVDRYAALSVGHPNAYAGGSLEQKLKGWYVLFFQIPFIAESALRAFNWWWFRRFAGYDDEVPHWIAQLSRPGRLTAGINYYRANIGMVLRRDWPAVRVPVMGVWSDGDRFLAESQMRAAQDFVAAPFRYERVAGANHWLQLTAAARVNTLLLDYLH
jgi:pimeloyl-ACP methyl ester carboxylesterase